MSKKPANRNVAKTEVGTQLLITANKGGSQNFLPVHFWVIGDTPLIVHAWSQKAKRMMLGKHLGESKKGREIRDPEEDFLSSLYSMGDNVYGFPAMGIKKCLWSGGHKDKNIPKTDVQKGLWIDGDMTRVMPAKAGAICDLPLIRLYGSAPQMREDMVRVGSGLSKTATLAYRGQFTVWAMLVRGRYNPNVLNPEKLTVLINDGGYGCGVGEWRCEKSGPFGAFHMANVAEAEAWERFKAGTGALPIPENHYLEAAE